MQPLLQAFGCVGKACLVTYLCYNYYYYYYYFFFLNFVLLFCWIFCLNESFIAMSLQLLFVSSLPAIMGL
jgi:uncharacterized membrane-anchored protein YitT (DUF2179 family)